LAVEEAFPFGLCSGVWRVQTNHSSEPFLLGLENQQQINFGLGQLRNSPDSGEAALLLCLNHGLAVAVSAQTQLAGGQVADQSPQRLIERLKVLPISDGMLSNR
jgi:hypothetical protein